MFQGCTKDVSRILKGLSRMFQGCVKDVSTMFHGCYKDVPTMFQGCFKELLEAMSSSSIDDVTKPDCLFVCVFHYQFDPSNLQKVHLGSKMFFWGVKGFHWWKPKTLTDKYTI